MPRKPRPAAVDPARAKLDARTEELLRTTASFCTTYLDEELKNLSEKLIRKMSRKRVVPYAAGRVETWAGSVVYALCQINFLFDKGRPSHIKPDLIAKHFGVARATLNQRAAEIRAMFKMGYWDPEFGTADMRAKHPLANMVMVNGFILPFNMLLPEVQAQIRPGTKKPTRS